LNWVLEAILSNNNDSDKKEQDGDNKDDCDGHSETL